MWVFFLHVYMCIMCLCSAHGIQKMVSDPLALEAQMCEPPCGRWELNLGPQQEQQMLLTAEPYSSTFTLTEKNKHVIYKIWKFKEKEVNT